MGSSLPVKRAQLLNRKPRYATAHIPSAKTSGAVTHADTQEAQSKCHDQIRSVQEHKHSSSLSPTSKAQHHTRVLYVPTVTDPNVAEVAVALVPFR